jgi:hypothetical protein
MANPKDRTYTRLRGRSPFLTRLANAASLWKSEDGLVLATQTAYTESYQHFRFDDLQGILIVKTRRQLWYMLIYGLFGLLGLFLAVVWEYTRMLGWIFFGAAMIAHMLNWLKGETCATYLRTAVKLQEVSCLSRLPVATAAAAEIDGWVQERQGTLRLDQLAAASTALSPSRGQGAAP